MAFYPVPDRIMRRDKSRQDKMKMEVRPRVIEWFDRREAWGRTNASALATRVEKIEGFLASGTYGLRHLQAYMRYTKAV